MKVKVINLMGFAQKFTDRTILGLIFILTFIIYFPSLFVFFTHDDFFLLKIAKVSNIFGFLNFFNFLQGPDGLGMYRPLTTQVYYFLATNLFNLNPLPLHIVSFIFLFVIIYLVYIFAKQLTGVNKVGLFAAFLYAVSATHFAHMYYLATFQELGLTLFYFTSSICLIKFITRNNYKHLIISLFAFIGALLSKETAIALPATNVLILFYFRFKKKYNISVKRTVSLSIPFLVILATYSYFHIFRYGFAEGESYIWDFSVARMFNTTFWYGLWSFNIPEMLVDFVGPGIHINPKLFQYWSKQIIPILILFLSQLALLAYAVINNVKGLSKTRSIRVILFSVLWFLITLLPVIFLPIHKFAFYLTLPLVGFVILVSWLLLADRKMSWINITFGILFLLQSVIALSLTRETHWITQGERTSLRVHNFMEQNISEYRGKTVVFVDTPMDADLPWSPTSVLQDVLSKKNFFDVFYQNTINVKYGEENVQEGDVTLPSRQFLGY